VDFDHLPVKNELVACRFLADGNYYRAKVLDVNADAVKVVYVDYGNMDCATQDRLKPLTDSLKRVRLKQMSTLSVLPVILYAHITERFFLTQDCTALIRHFCIVIDDVGDFSA
jgi:hypothetical protein